MPLDYNKYKEKKQGSIDFSKFMPTGENLQQVSSYIQADKDRARQEEIDRTMKERKKQIKTELARQGSYTSLFRNAWESVKSGETTRDIFDSLKPENIKETSSNIISSAKNVIRKAGDIFGESSGERYARVASEVLGEEVKPGKEYRQKIKQVTPEQKDLIFAKVNEETAQNVAKITTAPIRFTAGSLLTGITSYALERADSDFKYTPKTDAEKLLIGEGDIKKLTEQEDIYGTVARGAGIPVALTLMAVLENPFLEGTGTNKLIKEGMEKIISKQGSKILSKIGTDEIIKIADELIQKEVKAGKFEKEMAEKAVAELKKFRVIPVDDVKSIASPDEQKLLPTKSATRAETIGDNFVMKGEADAEKIKLSRLNNDYQKKLEIFNKQPTAQNLEAVKLSRQKYFDVKDAKIEPTPVKVVSEIVTPTIKKADEITTIEKQASNYNTVDEYISGVRGTNQSEDAINEFASKYPDLKTEADVEKKLTEIWEGIKKTEQEAKVKSINNLGDEVFEDGKMKVSKLAKEASETADELEKTVGEEFKELPGYTSRKIKSQSEKTAKLLNEDLSSVRAMIRGEKEIPDDISPAYLWQAAEKYAEKIKDAKMIRELSRSKLASDVSQGASELRMIAERNADSPARIVESIRNARAKVAEPLSKKNVGEIVVKERKAIQDKVRYEIKKAIKVDDWKKFIDEIRC